MIEKEADGQLSSGKSPVLFEYINNIPSLKEPRKAERIVPAIVNYICTSGMTAGSKLPSEKELSEILGVGRRSLREAMISLQTVGLIQSKHGMGWYVERFEPANSLRFLAPMLEKFSGAGVEQIMETRLAVEPMIARKAAKNITLEGLDQLSKTLNVMNETSSDSYLEEFRDNDRKFHDIIAQECGNCLLYMISSLMTGLFYSIQQWIRKCNYKFVLQQHREIFDSIKSRDDEGAERAMAVHIRESWKFISSKTAESEKF